MVEANTGNFEEPVEKKPRLSEEEHQELKKRLRARKKLLTTCPLFQLKNCGLTASLKVPQESRIPVSVSDVQALMIYTQVGMEASFSPFRWCNLEKWNHVAQTIVLAVDNVSVAEFSDNPDCFPETHHIFQNVVEMLNPRNDGYSFAPALAFTPVSLVTLRRLHYVYGSLREAEKAGFLFGPDKLFDSAGKGIKKQFVLKEAKKGEFEEQTKKPCTKIDLLLSPTQLSMERFPLPGSEDCKDFVFTKDDYAPVTETSPMYSIDCEWVLCQDGTTGLARVAIVDEHLQTVYHTFVNPEKPIADYLTKYSGITREILRGVTTTTADIQQKVRKLLPPDAIIVGQSVNCDLKAMKLLHPYIIDTSVIYNLTGIGHCKTRLRVLTSIFCGRKIQIAGKDGHNPIEDALAAMELILLKLENGISYGDVRLGYGAFKLERQMIKKSYQLEFDVFDESCSAGANDESEFDKESLLQIKLFSYIQCLNKGATLITSNPEMEKLYRPKVMLLDQKLIKIKDAKDGVVGPVRSLNAKDLPSIVQAVRDTRSDSNFTVIHTGIEKIEEESARKKKWKQLDKAIGDIFKQIPVKGMMVVVFGGSEEDPTRNGACLVRINQPERPLL